MNTHPASIIVDSCQYTPVYLVQETGAIQGRSYVVTQGNVEDAKPVTDNLKRFYENSGIFEKNVGNNVSSITKPRILKRQDSKLLGTNLKLTNLVLPKSVNCNIQDNYPGKQCLPVSNVILKPTDVAPSVLNNVATVEVSRKVVKLKNFPNALKTTQRERISPKIKPKEDQPNVNPTKHTSVQLLKLGETYHSLNQLSGDQMKMVNQAMKIYSSSEKPTMLEATYDPVTNTCFMYNIVSPKDITVVGKNKIVINPKKEENKKEPKNEENIKEPKNEEIKKEPKNEENKKEPKKEENKKESKKEEYKKEPKKEENKKEPKKVQEKEIPKPELVDPEETDEEEPDPFEIKVTRSGRKVKFPKQIVEETPQKPKKKTVPVVSCFQCASEFCSLYRLQKHYENHPTHIPAKVHSDLFHCLLAILKSGTEEDRTNIFIQQLEQLIEKLKFLLPCLMKKIDGSEGKSCIINDDIGRLFGMNPGKYNLNMEALTCVKDKNGKCRHNPPKGKPPKSDPNSPSQLWHTIHNDDITKVKLENETEDCARISSVYEWPTAQKRLNNSKMQKTQQLNKHNDDKTNVKLENETEDCARISSVYEWPTAQKRLNNSKMQKTQQLNKHNDDRTNVKLENETEDCARISSVYKWPTAQKRLNNSKMQKTHQLKRLKLVSEVQLQQSQEKQSREQQSIEQQPTHQLKRLKLASEVQLQQSQEKQSREQQNIEQQPTQQLKRLKLASEVQLQQSREKQSREQQSIDQQPGIESDIQLKIDDLVNFGTYHDQSAINVQQESLSLLDNLDLDVGNESPIHQPNLNENQSNIDMLINQTKKSTSIHNQFHSTHFDIRSSPIKSSASIFHKFQINSEKLGKYDLQLIRPLDLNHDQVEIPKDLSLESIPSIASNCDTSDLDCILRDDLQLHLSPCPEPSGIPPELSFDTSKDWIIETELNESFLKTNSVVEPSLLHAQPSPIDNLALNNLVDSNELGDDENHLLSSRSSSVLNFLESLSDECLSYPETDIRNNPIENVDFQLDLFSFSNT